MKVITALVLAMALGGCSGLTEQQQRALSGGAIGAASGVGLAIVTGGSSLLGGVVGGAAGAAVGALLPSGGKQDRPIQVAKP